MKLKIIIPIILVVIFGLAALGYFRAVPGVEDETTGYPRIEITPKNFNFGEVNFGKVAEYAFKIKNLGDAVLEIRKVATSCGCTTATVDKEQLNPGEEMELSVSYDTAVMGDSPHGKGEQERIIYVKSNDPLNPQVEVTINAYVK